MPVVEGVAHAAPSGWLNAREAAVYLGLSTRTLANMRSRGVGPRYSKPGRVIYRKADLDIWLNAAPAGVSTEEIEEAKEEKGL